MRPAGTAPVTPAVRPRRRAAAPLRTSASAMGWCATLRHTCVRLAASLAAHAVLAASARATPAATMKCASPNRKPAAARPALTPILAPNPPRPATSWCLFSKQSCGRPPFTTGHSLSGLRCNLDVDDLHPAHQARNQSHLDAARVFFATRQQVTHDARGELAARLVLLHHDRHPHPRANVAAVSS